MRVIVFLDDMYMWLSHMRACARVCARAQRHNSPDSATFQTAFQHLAMMNISDLSLLNKNNNISVYIVNIMTGIHKSDRYARQSSERLLLLFLLQGRLSPLPVQEEGVYVTHLTTAV